MKVIIPGHVYDLHSIEGGPTQQLTFMRRSSDAVQYASDWPGLQTQEVLRALINRTDFVQQVLACNETPEAAYHLRMAMWFYEARAWRRKHQKRNKTDQTHCYENVPFSHLGIETWPVGEDGHIVLTDQATQAAPKPPGQG